MSSAPPASDLSLSPPAAEANSARQVFREMDKACRAARTYGLSNSVTRRFFDQLQAQMLAHLESWPVLAVVVDRAELRMHEEAVYRSEDSVGESLAFRLFGDGVRELRFEHGLSPEDLHAFLDALWGQSGAPGAEDDGDDDVVTRLWDKDLATISFLTAEDIVQAPWSADLAPQEHGFFAPPPESFGPLLEKERSRAAGSNTHSGKGPPAAGDNLAQGGGGLVGFEIEEGERAAVMQELAGERGVDATSSVLAMVKAILECELTADLLSRALGVMPGILDALLAEGNWPSLLDVLTILESVADTNPEFGPTDRILAQRVVQSLSLPDRVALIEKGLEQPRPLAGFAELLARLDPQAVGALCSVMANVPAEEPRLLIRDALIRLGKGNPEPVLKGLADPRPRYARDLILVIGAWQLPQASEVLAMVSHHPAAEVRQDALAVIARLHPSGDAAPLLAFVSDQDGDARQHALRLLASGRYTAPWEGWTPHLADKEAVIELPRAEKRLLFQALRASAADGAVVFWQELLGGKGWKQRQKKEETALLAVRSLASLGTPRALEALEFGKSEGSGAVRKACAAELARGKG